MAQGEVLFLTVANIVIGVVAFVSVLLKWSRSAPNKVSALRFVADVQAGLSRHSSERLDLNRL